MEFSPFGAFPPNDSAAFSSWKAAVLLSGAKCYASGMTLTPSFRSAVRLVALLNLAYFGVEMAVALKIGSVSLLADSADFFEDAAVNLLILAALGWSASRRAKVGGALAAILLAPAVAFLWTLWRKVGDPTPPEALSLGVTGLGAMAVNLFCAFTLVRHRGAAGSLSKAAFLSARNDVLANIGIVAAGLLTAATRSIWPDIVVGLAIAIMNLDAAREVWEAAREDAKDAHS